MPIVEITLFEGRSKELKKKLIEEPKENFGFGGRIYG